MVSPSPEGSHCKNIWLYLLNNLCASIHICLKIWWLVHAKAQLSIGFILDRCMKQIKACVMWSTSLLAHVNIHNDFHEPQISLIVHQNFRSCLYTAIGVQTLQSAAEENYFSWSILMLSLPLVPFANYSHSSGTFSRKNSLCITRMSTTSFLRDTSTKCA